MIFCFRMNIDIFFDPAAADFFDFFDRIDVNAVCIEDVTVGIAHCNDFAAQLCCFDSCVSCYVAGTGNDDGLAFK